jgi:nicotinamide-nucleotide amidase
MFSPEILDLAQKVITTCKSQGKKIVTAESCTGGLIAGALTEIPGASAVIERGFITYSNDAKMEALGVMPDMLEEFGAVSGEVAEAMAQGALEFSQADVAVSATGVAGPDGGTLNKPIGLVFIGIATREGGNFHIRNQFKGDRNAVRLQAVQEALRLIMTLTDKEAS